MMKSFIDMVNNSFSSLEDFRKFVGANCPDTYFKNRSYPGLYEKCEFIKAFGMVCYDNENSGHINACIRCWGKCPDTADDVP